MRCGWVISRKKGQAVVEAALVLPLFLLILCGILDFGWIFAHQIALNNTSRDAARYATIQYAEADLQNLVTSRVQATGGMGGGAGILVTVIKLNGDVTVQIQKNIRVLTPLAGIFVSGQIVAIKSETTMWAG